jgi:hypothetical protein
MLLVHRRGVQSESDNSGILIELFSRYLSHKLRYMFDVVEFDDLKTLHTKGRTKVVNTPGSDSITANGPPVRSCSLLSSGSLDGNSGPTRLGEVVTVAFMTRRARIDQPARERVDRVDPCTAG